MPRFDWLDMSYDQALGHIVKKAAGEEKDLLTQAADAAHANPVPAGALLGAGVGGLGGLLFSRRRRRFQDALTGALLGAGAGTAGGALYQGYRGLSAPGAQTPGNLGPQERKKRDIAWKEIISTLPEERRADAATAIENYDKGVAAASALPETERPAAIKRLEQQLQTDITALGADTPGGGLSTGETLLAGGSQLGLAAGALYGGRKLGHGIMDHLSYKTRLGGDSNFYNRFEKARMAGEITDLKGNKIQAPELIGSSTGGINHGATATLEQYKEQARSTSYKPQYDSKGRMLPLHDTPVTVPGTGPGTTHQVGKAVPTEVLHHLSDAATAGKNGNKVLEPFLRQAGFTPGGGATPTAAQLQQAKTLHVADLLSKPAQSLDKLLSAAQLTAHSGGAPTDAHHFHQTLSQLRAPGREVEARKAIADWLKDPSKPLQFGTPQHVHEPAGPQTVRPTPISRTQAHNAIYGGPVNRSVINRARATMLSRPGYLARGTAGLAGAAALGTAGWKGFEWLGGPSWFGGTQQQGINAITGADK